MASKTMDTENVYRLKLPILAYHIASGKLKNNRNVYYII